MVGEQIERNFPGADTADARHSPGEELVYKFLRKPERLENLGTDVALKGRDTHLGHRLHHAFFDSLAEVFLCLVLQRNPLLGSRAHA